MKYMMLIYNDEKGMSTVGESERGKMYGEYVQFTKDITASGNYKGGSALQPSSTATSVRMRDGKRVTTDGPFAETREQLGGYYLVEAADLTEAIAMAARIPGARTGTVEVRPLREM
jgi:hypothetical protein